jgi:site-specific recombinase XerC
VVTTASGDPVHPHSISQTFDRIARRAPVPIIRFHELRHTHGSLLIAYGVDAMVVKERLGHGDFVFTVQTYQHTYPPMHANAADVFETCSHRAGSKTPRFPKPVEHPVEHHPNPVEHADNKQGPGR